MNEMKDVVEGAHFWLKGHTTTIWARHMFRSDGLIDTILNNMCESFNSRILSSHREAHYQYGMKMLCSLCIHI